jgi:hypothetical protein
MITTSDIAEIYGINQETVRKRIKRAKIPANGKTGNSYLYPKEPALQAALNNIQHTPSHLISIAELAQNAERTKGCITYRLRKAGITPCSTITRRAHTSGSGGYPMHLYPRTQAMLAALDK